MDYFLYKYQNPMLSYHRPTPVSTAPPCGRCSMHVRNGITALHSCLAATTGNHRHIIGLRGDEKILPGLTATDFNNAAPTREDIGPLGQTLEADGLHGFPPSLDGALHREPMHPRNRRSSTTKS